MGAGEGFGSSTLTAIRTQLRLHVHALVQPGSVSQPHVLPHEIKERAGLEKPAQPLEVALCKEEEEEEKT